MSLRCRFKREGRCRGGKNQFPVLSLHRHNRSHYWVLAGAPQARNEEASGALSHYISFSQLSQVNIVLHSTS